MRRALVWRRTISRLRFGDFSNGRGVKLHAEFKSDMEPARHISIVRFGTFELSLQSGELRKAGVRVRVQQQPMKLLEILLEHPGEVVTREVLRNEVWASENFGDFDQAVNIAIAKLRSALGDSADNPRYIETLPKRGYRFIADVTVADGVPKKEKPESTVGSPSEAAPEHGLEGVGPTVASSPKPWRVLRVIVVLIVVLSLPLLAVWLFRSGRLPERHIRSLAVLPLDNLSGDASQDYFADGMTDELITDLAQIRALRVISRTSVMRYKEVRKPLPEIAQQLNVDAVVEGSVLRSGNQVRITAHLVEASTGKYLWAESYEGDLRDTIALQRKVARTIAEEIRIELTPQEKAALKRADPVDPDAYENYLKGRYFWNKRTGKGLEKAVDYFNQAIAKDPNFAAAYSGLADAYSLLGDWQYATMTPKEAMPKAEAAAKRALQLDDTLGEAHASLAFCLDGFDWNFEAGDKEFRRAIELDPGYATAHHWYSWHLALLGRDSEAISEMTKAENIDPLSLIINSDFAELLLLAHFPDESAEQSRRTIEMDPNFAFAHNQLAQAYLEKHMFAEAIAELQTAIRISGGSAIFTANLARAYVATGRRAEAVRLLNDLKKHSNSSSAYATAIAMVYTALGDKDQAMAWLETGYQERFNPGVLLRPCFDPLRSYSRFQELVHRVGLPS